MSMGRKRDREIEDVNYDVNNSNDSNYVSTSMDSIAIKIVNEIKISRIDSSITYPRLIDSIKDKMSSLVDRFKSETCNVMIGDSNDIDHEFLLPYSKIFSLNDDDCAYITIAIQEDHILTTSIKVRNGSSLISLDSFLDVWKRCDRLRYLISSHSNTLEAMWSYQREFQYKIPTTFIPLYAKAIYEHFYINNNMTELRVLDPCAGWGDRLIAAVTSKVKYYVGFDPNKNLRIGYVKLMELFSITLTSMTNDELLFSNGFKIISLPFEVGVQHLNDDDFDLCFTSPPYFDYEVYSKDNPIYVDWVKEFYSPLLKGCCDKVQKSKGYVALHLSDTSCGSITSFLKNQVPLITSLKMINKIGLQGFYSKETRPVYIFKHS